MTQFVDMDHSKPLIKYLEGFSLVSFDFSFIKLPFVKKAEVSLPNPAPHLIDREIESTSVLINESSRLNVLICVILSIMALMILVNLLIKENSCARYLT